MEFLTSAQISLNKAGYLVSNETNKPVFPTGTWVGEQRAAEYIVKLAEAIKDKTFSVNKIDDLSAIKQEVRNSINKANTKNYVDEPTKPVSNVNDELVKFALDFVGYEDQKSKADKINSFMQQFNSINDVEQMGEYFDEGLVKLNKIYTIAEILEAAKIHIEKLN